MEPKRENRLPQLIKDDDVAIGRDMLGHGPALATLLRVLKTLPPPACVALHGVWGSGKTTFLRRAQQQWTEAGGGPTIWFDPWEHERREDVVSPLLHTMVVQLQKAGGVEPSRLRHVVLGVAKTLLSLTARIGTAYLFGGAAGAELKNYNAVAGLKAEDFAQHFDGWMAYHDEISEAKMKFKELVDLSLCESKEPDARLVVFLDDLDRCLPDNVVALIEAVKLLLCGESGSRVIFVFGLDRAIVGEAICQRFPGCSVYTGESYLEKIFDLSIEIPPTTMERVQEYVTSRCSDSGLEAQIRACLSISPREDGVNLLCHVLSDPVFANPRVLTRVLNRVSLILADKERVQRIRDSVGKVLYQRLVVWIAGAERFQLFRQFFLGATLPELWDFHQAVHSKEKKTSHAATEILAMPGFLRYYDLLGLSAITDAPTLDKQRRRTGELTTLRDLDDLLRIGGL